MSEFIKRRYGLEEIGGVLDNFVVISNGIRDFPAVDISGSNNEGLYASIQEGRNNYFRFEFHQKYNLPTRILDYLQGEKTNVANRFLSENIEDMRLLSLFPKINSDMAIAYNTETSFFITHVQFSKVIDVFSKKNLLGEFRKLSLVIDTDVYRYYNTSGFSAIEEFESLLSDVIDNNSLLKKSVQIVYGNNVPNLYKKYGLLHMLPKPTNDKIVIPNDKLKEKKSKILSIDFKKSKRV